ncbi:TetR/AcrR family transcriptional regulator [Fredinandcohnia humi]
MISKFFKLEQEKRERILNAATKEFGEKGFGNASTNEIVMEAGISKGLLFHYFTNKKGLYLFLYDYYVELMVDELFTKLDLEDGDILSKWRRIGWLKFELMKRHPEMFDFLKSVYEETDSEVKSELEKRNYDVIETSYAKILSNIDTSLFKPNIDIGRAINIIIWTLEGYGNQQKILTKNTPMDLLNIEKLIEGMDEYIEMLKSMFYK